MLNVYSPAEREFLEKYIPGHKQDEIIAAFELRFGRTLKPSSVKAYKINHHIPSGTARGLPKGCGKLWTPERIEFLKDINTGHSALEVAELINQNFGLSLSASQIKAIRGRLHLDSGVSGRFKKGHIPPNKGKKGYCSPGSEKGWFKKGQSCFNKMKVGEETFTTDGYIKVKVGEPNKWRFKHRLVWEVHNGRIPKGMIVTFKDGNKLNCSIDNLVLITCSENMYLTKNNLRSNNPEMADLGVAVAKLKSAIHGRKKTAR